MDIISDIAQFISECNPGNIYKIGPNLPLIVKSCVTFICLTVWSFSLFTFLFFVFVFVYGISMHDHYEQIDNFVILCCDNVPLSNIFMLLRQIDISTNN